MDSLASRHLPTEFLKRAKEPTKSPKKPRQEVSYEDVIFGGSQVRRTVETGFPFPLYTTSSYEGKFAGQKFQYVFSSVGLNRRLIQRGKWQFYCYDPFVLSPLFSLV